MQYIAAIVALAATASAHAVAYNNTVPTPEPVHEPAYVTEVVQDYTTVCPYATELTVGGKTYTVTEATTLTISDCSCTVSYEAPTPSAGYGSPAHPSAGYGSPAHPSVSHGSPAHPSAGYGSPAHPSAGYGQPGHPAHPSAGYGAPIVTGPGYSAPAANPTGAHPTPAAPYPTNGYGHSNGTAGVPVGTATRPVATGPAPQYTGAASKAGVALLGLAGAGLAAFL